MKKSFQFLAIIFTGLLFGNAGAQSTTVNKILKTGRDVQKIDTALSSVLNTNTINSIKTLFGKKGNKKNQPDSAQIPLAGSQSNNSAIAGNSMAAGNSKAGENIAGAKQLDADKLGPFIKGAAIMQKVNSTALIDASGNFIIPYNQYDISYVPSTDNQSYILPVGIFAAVKDYTLYLINPKGKILFSSTVTAVQVNSLRSDSKYAYLDTRSENNGNNKTICVNEEGNKYVLNSLTHAVSEGLFYGYSDGKAGYYNIKNELVIAAAYDDANYFSEGLALVGKKDEFGRLKYGYIDKKGKAVIPFIYTRKPGDFNNGLAKVFAMSNADFTYAFINKEGKIFYKDNYSDRQKYGEFNAFMCGIAISNDAKGNLFVMDTTGRIATQNEFLERCGIKNGYMSSFLRQAANSSTYYNSGSAEELTEIIFTQGRIKGFNTGSVNAGLIDLKTGKITLPALFYVDRNIPAPFKFDPVSGLLYAEIRDATDHVLKEGYINREGMYVMVKGQPSTW